VLAPNARLRSEVIPSVPVNVNTSPFVVVAQPVGPDKIQIGLAPVSMATADPSNARL
jgi:hypothetical protein